MEKIQMDRRYIPPTRPKKIFSLSRPIEVQQGIDPKCGALSRGETRQMQSNTQDNSLNDSRWHNWNTYGISARLLRDSHFSLYLGKCADARNRSALRCTGQRAGQLLVVLTLLVTASACTSPSDPVEIPTRAPAPTFTPTTEAAAAAPQPAAAQPAAEVAAPQPAVEALAPPTVAPVQEAVAVVPVVEEPTAEPSNAQVLVNTQLLNVRGGPGTNYATVGIVDQGERFNVTGKNAAGDWWEIEYNSGRAWVFNELVVTENTGSVSIAALIPVPPPPTAAPVIIVQPTAVPFVPQSTPTLTAAQAAYYAAIAAGQNPNPNPVAQQPVAQQPAAPQPTAVPAEPTPVPEPAKPKYEFNIVVVSRCEPQAGGTWFSGKTYKNGEPKNGYNVVFSYEPNGPKVTNPMISGPHEGYNGWDTGYYSHIISANEPRAGNWFVWIEDDGGSRISEIGNFSTDGDSNTCNQAIVDFDSR